MSYLTEKITRIIGAVTSSYEYQHDTPYLYHTPKKLGSQDLIEKTKKPNAIASWQFTKTHFKNNHKDRTS